MIVKSIKIQKNKIIFNKKGNIIKFLNKNSKQYKSFGEIYFSEIKKNVTKGWNIHYKFYSVVTVPYGKVEFNFFNPKKKKKVFKKVIAGGKKNISIQIPPGIWFSFKSLSKISVVANLLNKIHDKKETNKATNINGKKIR